MQADRDLLVRSCTALGGRDDEMVFTGGVWWRDAEMVVNKTSEEQCWPSGAGRVAHHGSDVQLWKPDVYWSRDRLCRHTPNSQIVSILIPSTCTMSMTCFPLALAVAPICLQKLHE